MARLYRSDREEAVEVEVQLACCLSGQGRGEYEEAGRGEETGRLD